MLKNYLLTTARHLARAKVYALINILGLSVGLACCILAFLHVRFELSYDRFHSKADRIYRITDGNRARIGSAWGLRLASDFPQITAVLFNRGDAVVGTGDRRFAEDRFFYVSPQLFEVFDFELIRGDPAGALREPYTLVLTEEAARKYFGDEDPLGRTLPVNFRDRSAREAARTIEYEITGVVRAPPAHSHLHFDFLASIVEKTDLHESTDSPHFFNYILLEEGFAVAELERELPAFFERHRNMYYTKHPRLEFQPLTDIHLHSRLEREIEPNGDIAYVYIFSVGALFALLISCINFANLATARGLQRAREVGVRKTLGGGRTQLVGQFLGEAMVMSFAGLLLAVVLTKALLPPLNALTGRALPFDLGVGSAPLLLGLGLLVGLLAGAYPAFFLSALQPVRVLKGAFKAGRAGIALRKALVTAQFAVSAAIVIATLICLDQLAFIQTKNTGLHMEQVLSVSLRDQAAKDAYPALKHALLQHADVVGVTAALEPPAGRLLDTGRISAEGKIRPEDEIYFNVLVCDRDFVRAMGVELLAGRDFSPDRPSDVGGAFLINEAALRRIGWAAPEQAVGRRFSWRDFEGEVIGVTADFHFSSLHHRVVPLVLIVQPQWLHVMMVRVRAQGVERVEALLRALWDERLPHDLPEWALADDLFAAVYRNERQLGQLLVALSAATVFIACLGLLGLASFTISQRTKEVGIRKALGASTGRIVLVLSGGLARSVVVAGLLACPAVYWGMGLWLRNFAYRVDLEPGNFAAGIAALLICAGLAVGRHTLRAARANPVDALRSE